MTQISDCGCKLDRKADEYNLPDLNEELFIRHQEKGASLRDLETFVNTRILESVMKETDIVLLDGAESVYHQLTNDDIGQGKRAEIKSRLEQAGININKVQDDFVTYQTVRKHLQVALNVDTGKQEAFDTADAESRVHRLQSRCEAVIAQTLEQLRRRGNLETGDLDLVLSIRITCESCGHSYRLRELIDSGQCHCGGTLS